MYIPASEGDNNVVLEPIPSYNKLTAINNSNIINCIKQYPTHVSYACMHLYIMYMYIL